LVRQHPDGVLEFVGRVDNQVKVRGFRVEPGEVEECLRDWGLREVVVRADRDVHGDARLVAYVVLDGGHAGSGGKVEALREHARRHLPEYMVPAVFVVLPKLLLNPNGKVDMAALPPPPTGDRGAVADRVAPGTPTERALAAIWRDLLVVPEVFADDDFFDLGGRSLKATRTRTRLSAAIGVDVPLRLVFEHPTLAALAAAADRLAAGGNQAGAGSEEAGDHPAAADGATAPAPASPLSVADLLAHLEQPNARTTG
jgi:hypothetical protein